MTSRTFPDHSLKVMRSSAGARVCGSAKIRIHPMTVMAIAGTRAFFFRMSATNAAAPNAINPPSLLARSIATIPEITVSHPRKGDMRASCIPSVAPCPLPHARTLSANASTAIGTTKSASAFGNGNGPTARRPSIASQGDGMPQPVRYCTMAQAPMITAMKPKLDASPFRSFCERMTSNPMKNKRIGSMKYARYKPSAAT